MRIKRLHIGDFGILQNQTLEDLNSGLVIVGGCNRAGKSTLMQALRFLGYGVPKRSNIPPANVQYMIDADMRDEITGKDYHIRLQGHSEPVCTVAGEGERIPASQLYPLDDFTYRNLYTISLDQLARQPEGVSDKEMNKLQAALLGAGLMDIANIPRLKERFMSQAEKIGGKRGKISVKNFRPHTEYIRKGTALKNTAISQVDDYLMQKDHLTELEEGKKVLEEQLEKIHAEKDIIETVLSNYEVLEELISLNDLLKHHNGTLVSEDLKWENRSRVEEAWQSWLNLKEQWQKRLGEFAIGAGKADTAEKMQSLLLNRRSLLQKYMDMLSGLQERWNNLDRTNKQLKYERQTILNKINELNADWGEKDVDRIRQLKLEWLELQKLISEVKRFQSVQNDLKLAEGKLKNLNEESEKCKASIKEWEKQISAQSPKLYLWIIIASAVLGLTVSFIHPIGGLLLGLCGIIGSALFMIFKGLGQKDAAMRVKEWRVELERLVTARQQLEQDMEQMHEEYKKSEMYLFDICNKLGLDTSVPLVTLPEYYQVITGIRQSIIRLDDDEKEFREQFVQLAAQLNEIDRLISELEKASLGLEEERHDDTMHVMQPDTWAGIQNKLKKWYNLMNDAIELKKMSQDMQMVEKRIHDLIGRKNHTDLSESPLEDMVQEYLVQCKAYSEYKEMEKRRDDLIQVLIRDAGSKRIQDAFSLVFSKTEKSFIFDQFFDIFDKYPVKESLQRVYENLSEEMRRKMEELEKYKNDIIETKHLLDQLSHTEKLEQAHEMIQRGRNGLYQVSYEYAVQRAAAWLCEEINNEFMTRMKDELLLKADSILRQLTGEVYQRIIPNDDLSDFFYELKDGTMQRSSQVLSRGTREQVFLAVRLGRIMEMKPALPVIIDDSLVNFDCDHLKQAVEVIGGLSRTHQVFIMTCHPHLVEHFLELGNKFGSPAQFWKLEKGRFFPSDGLALMEYLG